MEYEEKMLKYKFDNDLEKIAFAKKIRESMLINNEDFNKWFKENYVENGFRFLLIDKKEVKNIMEGYIGINVKLLYKRLQECYEAGERQAGKKDTHSYPQTIR